MRKFHLKQSLHIRYDLERIKKQKEIAGVVDKPLGTISGKCES